MPLSTLTNMPQESSSASSTNYPQQQMIANNQNLLHVKFHVNKFQDNLLSKRLQQLNMEEMKQRLKHQRASNELVVFLKECQQTTGYLAKMKQIDNSHNQHQHHNRNNHFRYNPNSSYNADNSNSSTNNNPPLSNAVKNMINASILVVETSTSTSTSTTSPFESKSCPNYAQLIKSENNSNHHSHRKVAWVLKINSFSFLQALGTPKLTTESPVFLFRKSPVKFSLARTNTHRDFFTFCLIITGSNRVFLKLVLLIF
jgi:hypothetical protein